MQVVMILESGHSRVASRRRDKDYRSMKPGELTYSMLLVHIAYFRVWSKGVVCSACALLRLLLTTAIMTTSGRFSMIPPYEITPTIELLGRRSL